MLYKIVHDKEVFDLNPELLAIEGFARLTDRQFRYVALYADRLSPLKTLPDKERRERAAKIAGYKLEPDGKRLAKDGREVISGKVESIEKAIALYRELQFDENQDTLDTVNAQIQEIKNYLKSDKSTAKDHGKALEIAAKLSERLPGLVETKQKLETLLQITTVYKPEVITGTSMDLENEEGSIDSEELSTIDQYHLSKRNKHEGE
jgi:hypothetical protein